MVLLLLLLLWVLLLLLPVTDSGETMKETLGDRVPPKLKKGKKILQRNETKRNEKDTHGYIGNIECHRTYSKQPNNSVPNSTVSFSRMKLHYLVKTFSFKEYIGIVSERAKIIVFRYGMGLCAGVYGTMYACVYVSVYVCMCVYGTVRAQILKNTTSIQIGIYTVKGPENSA